MSKKCKCKKSVPVICKDDNHNCYLLCDKCNKEIEYEQNTTNNKK